MRGNPFGKQARAALAMIGKATKSPARVAEEKAEAEKAERDHALAREGHLAFELQPKPLKPPGRT